jgi:hypothetical protein
MTHKQFLLIIAPLLIVLLVFGYCAPKRKASFSPALRAKRKYVQSVAYGSEGTTPSRAASAAATPI